MILNQRLRPNKVIYRITTINYYIFIPGGQKLPRHF